MRHIYLDYAASTPLDARVLRAMQPYLAEHFGNPGSLHRYGQEAQNAVDKARETVAGLLSAEFRDVVFTGSATEANNLVIRGVLKGLRSKNTGLRDNGAEKLNPRIVISAIEHESILETARDLARDGCDIVELPVHATGVVDLEALRRALTSETVLVSIQYVNNETGVVQPIQEIAKVIKEFRMENLEFRKKHPHPSILPPKADPPPADNSEFYPLFHTDAAQAFQFFDCNAKTLGVDMMTLSGHKIYGPKGTGLLYARHLSPITYHLQPVITGGGQEFGLRSGTENVACIAGLAEATRLAESERAETHAHVADIKEFFIAGIKKALGTAVVNGGASGNETAPHIVNIYFPERQSDELLTAWDLKGLAASAGSACKSRAVSPSHVLRAMGCADARIKGSVRFSFGKATTRQEVEDALHIIKASL